MLDEKFEKLLDFTINEEMMKKEIPLIQSGTSPLADSVDDMVLKVFKASLSLCSMMGAGVDGIEASIKKTLKVYRNLVIEQVTKARTETVQ